MAIRTTSRQGLAWIWLAAAISTFSVVIHLAAIAGGPSWYAFFGAPPAVLASARAGTWLAPGSAAGIAFLMAICAAYALSAAGFIRRLPARVPVLACIAAICLLRALVVVPLALRHAVLRTPFEIIAAIVWGLAGVGFVAGLFAARRASRPRPD